MGHFFNLLFVPVTVYSIRRNTSSFCKETAMQRSSFRWYRVVPFVLCMVIMSFPFTTYGEHIEYGDSKLGVCRDKIPQVVEQFVLREFPLELGQLWGYSYKRPIGILCHESRPLASLTEAFEKEIRKLRENNSPLEKIRTEERHYAELFQSIITEHDDMFDVLIMVHLRTGESFWETFHIHFAYDGELVDTSSSDWKQIAKGCEWQKEWLNEWNGENRLEGPGCLPHDKTPAL